MAGQKGDEVTTWDMKVDESWGNLTDSHKWIRSLSSFIKFVLVTSVALSYSPASFPRTMVLKHQKKIKKINETPFYSPLESSFFAFFPSSPAWVARAQMDDVRTTISDSISLPALPRVHLASTPPPQQSSSSKEVDIKKHHGGLILQNESTM